MNLSRLTIILSLVTLVTVLRSAAASTGGYKLVATMTDNDGPVTCLTYDPLRKLIIHGDASGKLYFRDALTGQLFRKITAHGASVEELTFNSNGNLLLSASRDGEIKIYDFSKDAIVQSLYSPDYSGINFVLFSIADGFIYFNSVNKVFKTRSDFAQRVNMVAAEEAPISDAAISEDRGTFLYAAGSSIKVINTRTDLLIQEIRLASSEIHSLRFVNEGVLAVWCKDGTLSMYRFASGTLETRPFQWMKAGPPGDMCFSKDGTLMVSGNIGNWARVLRPDRKEVVQELFAHKGLVTTAIFGPSEGVLFTGSKDGTVRIWKDDSFVPEDSITAPRTFRSETSTAAASDSAAHAAITPETSPVQATPVPKNVPEVSKNEENMPVMIGGRQVMQATTIFITTSELTIFVFDNSTIDGDTMSLYFNDNWILDHYGVTKSKKAVKLQLKEGENNYLVMFANNLGLKAPNTAAIQFNDGRSDRQFRLSSDLSRCSSLNFIYRKP
ncbi:MAG: hypothetical protein RL213_1097 [Bacteroidota bacterium]